MTIRMLPAIKNLARPSKVESGISPQALARWNPTIRGAAGDGSSTNNVISILDEIGIDPWTGQGITANRVSGALRAIGNKPVTVEINSPGGDYFEGLAIYNALREHPQDVTVKVLGIAASAASVIAMAGDTIMVPRAGFLMIHNVWVVAMGNKDDLRAVADFLEPFDATAADVYQARSGMALADIVEMLDNETWIGGTDAVAKGLADSLLPSDQVDNSAKNAALTRPAAEAYRRIDEALAKGERLPRSERRKLIKDICGKPGAAEEEGTPRAADEAVIENDDGDDRLRIALAHLMLASARA